MIVLSKREKNAFSLPGSVSCNAGSEKPARGHDRPVLR